MLDLNALSLDPLAIKSEDAAATFTAFDVTNLALNDATNPQGSSILATELDAALGNLQDLQEISGVAQAFSLKGNGDTNLTNFDDFVNSIRQQLTDFQSSFPDRGTPPTIDEVPTPVEAEIPSQPSVPVPLEPVVPPQAPPPQPVTEPPTPIEESLPPAAIDTEFINEVVDLTNQFRAENGLAPLTPNPELQSAAQGHSEAMAELDFFSHDGIDGSDLSDRTRAEGYSARLIGENIAAGQPTPETVVQDWIDSPGHRENLLRPEFTEIGVGFVNLEEDPGNLNFRTYWTQNFGSGDLATN
ncbi:CAP domain-containing protein [Pseudanabaenaceae cyanobacterium LEGE 13415]|nr:CAP domain-containing protein [Pseudanabaenaceae cyanobacterium LEGE 13415]